MRLQTQRKMEGTLIIVSLLLPNVLYAKPVSDEYQPVGVPFYNTEVTFSSVNTTVSAPDPVAVVFPRYPVPSGLLALSPASKIWYSEVGLPQWIKIRFPQPIKISEFTFTGKLSFDQLVTDNKRGKTQYRLEAMNPKAADVMMANEDPSCTWGWETLYEDKDAKHFTYYGKDTQNVRTLKVNSKEAFSCYRLFFKEVPMDDDCRHFVIVQDIRMEYEQPAADPCKPGDKPCKCYGKESAFMGPNRKFVSWQMTNDDFTAQNLTYTFAPHKTRVFAFEFKTDKNRFEDGPTKYALVGKNEDEDEDTLFETKQEPFKSRDEVRQHVFDPPEKTYTNFTLRVKKVGWQTDSQTPPDGRRADFGWVQIRDVKFFNTDGIF